MLQVPDDVCGKNIHCSEAYLIRNGKQQPFDYSTIVVAVLSMGVAAFSAQAMAASVSGEIKVDSGKILKNTVVFLEHLVRVCFGFLKKGRWEDGALIQSRVQARSAV